MDETRYLPEDLARECLKVVQKFTDEHAGPGWNPKLYRPGHEGPFWNISLEGVEEWAYDASISDSIEWPDGVYVEAVNTWCLALYPAS